MSAGEQPTPVVQNVNLTINSPVMTNEYTEDIIIPQIKEALRRGEDIGIN